MAVSVFRILVECVFRSNVGPTLYLGFIGVDLRLSFSQRKQAEMHPAPATKINDIIQLYCGFTNVGLSFTLGSHAETHLAAYRMTINAEIHMYDFESTKKTIEDISCVILFNIWFYISGIALMCNYTTGLFHCRRKA